MEEDKKKRKSIFKRAEEILDQGDEMRKKGTMTHTQRAKEAVIWGTAAVAGPTALAVGDATYHSIHPKETLAPDSAHQVVLPEAPEHMQPAQTLIKGFEEKKGEGFAGKIQAEKQAPNDGKARE